SRAIVFSKAIAASSHRTLAALEQVILGPFVDLWIILKHVLVRNACHWLSQYLVATRPLCIKAQSAKLWNLFYRGLIGPSSASDSDDGSDVDSDVDSD